jgi:phage terminase large subunit-like protein
LGGRGSGKTLTGANHVFETAKNLYIPPTDKKIVRVALISQTFTDVRITMIEGDTGLRSIIPRELELAWNRSLGELKVQIPGSNYREIHFFAYSSERPELLRGPQHHLIWVDEPAKLKDANTEPTNPGTTWSNMMMGLRLGNTPHCVITGTPEPHKLIKYLVAHPSCVTHRMPTYENYDNLPQQTKEEYERLPRTSRVARQELFAELLLDNPNSIFSQELIEQYRQDPTPEQQKNLNKVLGWDPSMTDNPDSDEAGIFLSGWLPEDKKTDTPLQAFILEDHSGHFSPHVQSQIVTNLIIDQRISEVIMEQNQGAGFVKLQLETQLQAHPDVQSFTTRKHKKRPTKAGTVQMWKYTILFKNKNTPPHTFMLHSIQASVNKKTRADLVSVRYELGQVHHPTQGLPICEHTTCSASLEDQMVLWSEDSKGSPDRMDAAVYTLLHIFGTEHALSNKKPATIHTAARSKDLPEYDPRQDLTRISQMDLSRASRAYNVDIGGTNADTDSARFTRSR